MSPTWPSSRVSSSRRRACTTSDSTRSKRRRMRSTSVNGANRRRRSRRAPIGVLVASSTPSNVASRRPDTDSTSSKWLCATRSIASSVAGSQRAMRRAGSSTPGLQARAKRSARATARRAQRAAPPRPRRALPERCAISRLGERGCLPAAPRGQRRHCLEHPGRSARPTRSRPRFRADRARLSSANADGTSGSSAESSSPVEKSNSDTPTALGVTSSAAKKLLALDSRCSRSVTRPGRDHAHHLPRHDPLALGRVGHLLANRDLVPEREQPRDVAGGRVMRDPGQRDLVGFALISTGQRELEQRRGDAPRRRRTSRRNRPDEKRRSHPGGRAWRPRAAASPA